MKKNANKNAARKAKAALRRKERRKKKAAAGRNEALPPIYDGLPDTLTTVRDWEREHGKSPEGQDYLTLAMLREANPGAFAESLCTGLQKGSTAALCLYGMERCQASKADTPDVRRMDKACEESPVFAARQARYEHYREASRKGTNMMRFTTGEPTLAHLDGSERDIRGRALGLTALEAACELGFPAAFIECFEKVPYLASLGQYEWLVKGMEQGLVACTGILSRELRRGFWLPASAAEEQKLWDALLEHARKGSWTCLRELFLHLQKRPGFWNLPMADDTMALMARYVEQDAGEPIACLLWCLYFEDLTPLQSDAFPEDIIEEARKLLFQQPGLTRLRCLCALDDYGSCRQQQAIEDLRRCQLETKPGTQAALDVTTLLAMLPHSGKDNLREPDPERLEQLALLGVEAPELLTGYLWQGIVCNEGTSWQDNWLKAMDHILVPEDRYTSYMEGLLCLHGFGGRSRDVDKALALLARSAQAHFRPAAGLLADITGRGLCGCKAGPWQGIDWVAEGCRHLAPRALVVQGLIGGKDGHWDPAARPEQPGCLASCSAEELVRWCGRQDGDCLCQACSVLFSLEELVRAASAAGRGADTTDDIEAGLTGMDLADALCLALATADAGTFLYAGQELLRLVTESREYAQCSGKDKREAWDDSTANWLLVSAAKSCLEEMMDVPRRKTKSEFLSVEPYLAQLVFFCLDRAFFFGEPAARALRASLGQFMDLDRLAQDMEDANLNTPLRRFWCKTEHPVL